MKFAKVSVIGAGAWGTALAQAFSRTDLRVALWARKPEIANALNTSHYNDAYLPGIALSPSVKFTADLAEVVQADVIFLVVPVQHLRGIIVSLSKIMPENNLPPLVICCKGIEQKTLALPSEVVASLMPLHKLAVLSGPSFANEVAMGLPTAVTLACDDIELATCLASAIATPHFRPYTSDDVIGAQIGGAIKNVLAVACGIADGLGYGNNARAALITRGFSEMMRFGMEIGARQETLTGLSGIGDLVLTCSSTNSRNFSLGVELGKGRPLASIMAERHSIAEGVFSASAARTLSEKYGLNLPIIQAVDAILNHQADVRLMVNNLLARPLVRE